MTWLILFSIYFCVAAGLEMYEFHDYINGIVDIPDDYVVFRQYECWGWPFFLFLFVCFMLFYGFTFVYFFFTIEIPQKISGIFKRNRK